MEYLINLYKRVCFIVFGNDNLESMTVNERLYVTGLMDKYEKAVEARDIEKVKSILRNLKVDEESISLVIDSL